jgi:hypothetical protein
MYATQTETPAPTGPLPTLFEAIIGARCIEATYNGGRVLLAPHVAFTRHGDVYVGAATIERDGQPPREEKIGLFKLDGLVGLATSGRSFVPSPAFDPRDERFAAGTLIAVQPRGA